MTGSPLARANENLEQTGPAPSSAADAGTTYVGGATPGPLTPLDPGRVAKRISGLDELHPWLPPDALVAMARAPVSDQTLLASADAMRAAYSKVDGAIHWFHNDPVLVKEPSPLLALHRYLTSSIGPWPIEDSHLVSIQAGLQKAGFAQGLPTDGVWSTGWNAAWDQWSSKQSADVLAGKQVGGTTTGGALNHLLNAFLPTQAANAIAGFATGIAHTGRQAMADASGAMVGLSSAVALGAAHLVTHGNLGGLQTATRLQQMTGHFYAPWDPRYASPEATANMGDLEALGRGASAGFTLGGVGDAFKAMAVIHGAVKAGSDVSLANGLGAARELFGTQGARTAAARDLGLADALRGPGVIANSVGRVADLGNSFSNVPLLGRVGPWVAKLNDADGLYYRTRTLLATPSAFMPVRAAGATLGQGMLAGAKLRAEAAGVNLVGGQPTPFSSSIEGFHGADAVNDAVKNRLAFTAFGHHIQIGLNSLPFLLHIPTTAGLAPSDTIGRDVTGATSAVMHALGPSTSLAAQIERGAGEPVASMVTSMGGEAPFARFWTAQVYQHAAAHYAEVQMSRLADKPANEQAALDMTHAFEAEAYKGLADGDPTIMHHAIAEMLANDQGGVSYQMGGPNELSKRIARSIGYTTRGPKSDIVRDAPSFLTASDHLENHVLPNADFLVHPGSFEPVDAAPGRIGLARLDSLDAGQGALAVSAFRRRYSAISDVIGSAARDLNLSGGGVSAEKQAAVDAARADFGKLDHDVSEFMFRELGITAKRIPGDLGDKLDRAQEYVSKNLAGPIRVGGDAPQSLIDGLAAIKEAGYKPVYGRDIGWMHAAPSPLDVATAPLTRRRKLVESLGLSPQNVPSGDVSFWKYQGMRDQIQKLVDSGKAHLPPYHTPDSLLHYLWDENAIDLSPDVLTRGVFNTVGRMARSGRVDELLPKMASRTESEGDARKLAVGDLENELTRAMGLENIPRNKVVRTLTRPLNEAFPETFPASTTDELNRQAAAGGREPTLMTQDEANRVYRAIVNGSAAPPAYVLGANKLDQLARTIGSRMGFLGKVGPNMGTGTAGDLLANLPNELLTLRNRLRFQLSPEFSFRRITKANVKLWLDGVPATISPLHAMKAAGTYDEDLSTLDRVMPELHNPQYDQAAEALYSNDAFGFYSHRNWEAYAAGHWARQGLSDPEIRQLLVKDFGYGSKAFGEGRSPLERSVNQVFFPFSFDKTLYRNVGGYLLDHPARMMMLTGALNAYNAFSKAHPDTWGSGPWLDKHVPVLKEAQRLNAFAHGVSLGQFGGINAPLLNAFLPQKWDTNKHTLSTIGSFAPAVTELNNAYQEFVGQGGIASTAAGDEIRRITGHEDFTHPWVAAETPQAQTSDAYAMRRQMMTDLKPYLDANARRKAGAKITLNDPKYGKYDGQPVDSSLVDRIVHDRYPAFDPAAPAVFSDEQKAAKQGYLDNLSGPNAAYIRDWATVADKLGTDIYKGKYDSADAAANTQIIRNAAVWLAERDPAFFKAYGNYWKYQFGPLTEVKE